MEQARCPFHKSLFHKSLSGVWGEPKIPPLKSLLQILQLFRFNKLWRIRAIGLFFTNTLNQLIFEPSGPRITRSPKTNDTSVYRPPDARQRGEKQSLNIASIPLRHLKISIDCLKVPTLVKRYQPSSSCFPLYFPRQ
jgi:hypothetical protein